MGVQVKGWYSGYAYGISVFNSANVGKGGGESKTELQKVFLVTKGLIFLPG